MRAIRPIIEGTPPLPLADTNTTANRHSRRRLTCVPTKHSSRKRLSCEPLTRESDEALTTLQRNSSSKGVCEGEGMKQASGRRRNED
eukprot:scaffold24_cov186-Alexandrium_tamarense.AAC.50